MFLIFVLSITCIRGGEKIDKITTDTLALFHFQLACRGLDPNPGPRFDSYVQGVQCTCSIVQSQAAISALEPTFELWNFELSKPRRRDTEPPAHHIT